MLILTAVDDSERDRLSVLPAGFLLFAAAAALALAVEGPFASLLAGSGAGLAAFAVIGRAGGGEVADPGIGATRRRRR